jgi:Domain of unknown function (DUF4340)
MSAADGGRKRLLAVWVVLGLLAAGIALMEYRDSKRVPASVAEHVPGAEGSRLLIPAPIPDLGVIELVQAGRLHRFERDTAGLWYYHGIHNEAQQSHEHQTDPAQAEIIEKAFAALGRARMERQFKLDMQSGTYGLNAPQMVIVVYQKSNPLPLAQFAVGDVAPDEQSRYVLPVGSAYVVTIADYQIGNLLSLIDKMAGIPASPAPAANKS